MHVLHIYYYVLLRMPHPSKLMLNKVIISQNMLEFKIFFNIYKKNKKIKMEINLFYPESR